jgi:hypothetical protein
MMQDRALNRTTEILKSNVMEISLKQVLTSR